MQFLIKHSSKYIMNLKNRTNPGPPAISCFRVEGDGEKALEDASSAICWSPEGIALH